MATQTSLSGTPRNRRWLLLVGLLFAAPMLVALLLRAVGWHPAGLRNAGELIDPPIALGDIAVPVVGAGSLDWQVGERGWNVLAFPPSPCNNDCAALYDSLHRVWLSQGRHADRLRVLWFGALPNGAAPYAALLHAHAPAALLARLSHDQTGAVAPVYLVDSRGYVALRYPAGFDPSGLRKDITRLLK